MLILSDKFADTCQQATIYLDTNVFICAQEQIELAQVISDLTSESKAAFVTLSSVVYEYSRGSRTLEEISVRREFVTSLVSNVLPIGKLLEHEKNDIFSAAMSLVVGKKNSQYTDYLLAVALHAYKNSINDQFILSADIRAFPLDLFDIAGVITLSRRNGEITHLHLVRLDEVKYAGILGKLRNGEATA